MKKMGFPLIPYLGILSVFLTITLGCQSTSVLTPIEDRKVVVEGAESISSPLLTKLNELLAAQKYQGAGLQYESESTLEMLTRVFSDQRTWNRQISLIYTGLSVTYDPRHRSMTIPFTKDAESIVRFIAKTVPLRPTETKAPTPAN